MGAALVLVVLALAVTAVVLVGRKFAPAVPTVDYRAAVITDRLPLPLDPLVDASDPGVAELGSLTYRPLLRLDGTAYPVPDLAAGLVESVDGLTYAIPLQNGLRWSDGSPITALDALATIDWVQSAGFPDPTLAADWKGVGATLSGSVLLLTLPAPRASFAVTLTELPILPLGTRSPSTIAGLAAHATSPLPTSGPYMVVGRTGTTITLATNPYANPGPRLRRVVLEPVTSFQSAASAFASGLVDAVLATTPAERAQLLRRKGSRAHDLLTFGMVDLLFNERAPGLDDVTVRRAIAEAVDRASIVSGPLGGLGVAQAGPIPAGIRWISAGQPPPPAVQAAEAALDAAGWVVGAGGGRSRDGVALSFDLSVADAAPLPAVAQVIAGQLGVLGIAVDVSVVPATSFLSSVLEPGSFQMAIASWDLGPDPDVSELWASTATPPNGYDVSGGAADPFLDQDLETLATVGREAQRASAAARVAADLASDAPAVLLYAPEESLVVSKNLASVSVPAAGDPFDDAASWG